MKFFRGIVNWFKQAKISFVTKVPFQRKDEKFKGIKITLPIEKEPE